MIELAKKLYPIHRSITGEGNVLTLEIIKEQIPIAIKQAPSGEKVFDWEIPPEWNIKSAYVVNLNSGEKVVDFKNHNLHVVGYSQPVDKECSFTELSDHIHYLEDQPDAIPYCTSYYADYWGFCVRYKDFQKLDKSATYRVFIDSDFNSNGKMTYGELIVPGKTDKEIFFSSYICHPQMCNNELSGPVLLTELAKHVLEMKNRNFTYRFILIPETIGSIMYLAKNIDHLKHYTHAGFNLTCVGDERDFSYLPSRKGDTISDRVAKYVLDNSIGDYTKYTWLDRGSDERQYCAPGVDLPICSVMRSKFRTYPEYHTSLDNFDLVTEDGLQGSFRVYKKIIDIFEHNYTPRVTVICEPQLGRRKLYPSLSIKNKMSTKVKDMRNFLSFCDGDHSVLDISEKINLPFEYNYDLLEKLIKEGLVTTQTEAT